MEARDYVRVIREHKLTQAQIAEKTGIPQPTISKIERGEVDDVMSRNYRALKALHDELEGIESAKEPITQPGAL
jgi:transcriptional regulator with XRE-family HTH domain